MVSILAVVIYTLFLIFIFIKVGQSKKLGILGILVDKRGKYSLSRLQALSWTFLIGAAYLGIAVDRASFIEIPGKILALIGISLGSAVVSQAIKTYKIDTQLTVNAVKDSQPIHPTLIDIISEEEAGFESRLSLGKFQMLVWTVISLAIYAVILLIKATSSDMTELPDITLTMVELMGISNGAYLIHKIPS